MAVKFEKFTCLKEKSNSERLGNYELINQLDSFATAQNDNMIILFSTRLRMIKLLRIIQIKIQNGILVDRQMLCLLSMIILFMR